MYIRKSPKSRSVSCLFDICLTDDSVRQSKKNVVVISETGKNNIVRRELFAKLIAPC